MDISTVASQEIRLKKNGRLDLGIIDLGHVF